MRGARGSSVVALCALLLTGCGGTDHDLPPVPDGTVTAESFLQTYVEVDGRVVRRDQGGDTVSEGPAYAMLIALIDDDQATFDRVWAWTRDNLGRDDGLVSWHWADGAVVDESSASDAEIDLSRALLLAEEQWGGDYRDEAIALGTAVLDHLTVSVPAGRLLVPGQWATQAPYAFNPSYVSPVATSMLSEASGDPRWEELESGSRAALESLAGALPPDWAVVDADGTASATASPDGSLPPGYGYDAARTPLRLAESCDDADRAMAAAAAQIVARSGESVVARYDLQGAPQTQDTSPLATLAQAAGFAVDSPDSADSSGSSNSSRARATAAVDQALEQQRAHPTYYGDAWAVLGPALLYDPALGGCPPLAE